MMKFINCLHIISIYSVNCMADLHWNINNIFFDIEIFYNCILWILLSYLTRIDFFVLLILWLYRSNFSNFTDCCIHNKCTQACTIFQKKNTHSTSSNILSFCRYSRPFFSWLESQFMSVPIHFYVWHWAINRVSFLHHQYKVQNHEDFCQKMIMCCKVFTFLFQ